MLTGRFDRNMDKKGRVFIPAKFREELGSKVVLCQSIDGKHCLCIYTSVEYTRLLQRIYQLKLSQRNLFLRYLSSSVEVEYDAQGRVNIPPELREFANLNDENPVMIIGTDDKVELWNLPDWDALCFESSAETIAQLVDEVDL